MATQLSTYLHEIITQSPSSFKCWLTEDQRQRVNWFVDRILSESLEDELVLHDARTPKQIFKAAVHASRFITRTSAFVCRYEQSIISILSNLCSEEDMLDFFSTADEKMVEDIDKSWSDQMSEMKCSIHSFEMNSEGTRSHQPSYTTHYSFCDLMNSSHSLPLSSSSLYHDVDDGTPKMKKSIDPTSPAPSISSSASSTLSQELPEVPNITSMIRTDFSTQSSQETPEKVVSFARMKSHATCPNYHSCEPYIPVTGSSNPITVTKNDVLFGRGALANNHPGNIRFRQMAERLKPLYRKSGSNNNKKKEFSLFLIKCVRRYGGRFLVTDPVTLGWVEADLKKQRLKCSQALREQKKNVQKSKS